MEKVGKNLYFVIASLLVVVFLIAVLASVCYVPNKKEAYADTIESGVVIEQTEKIYYRAENYLRSNTLKNMIFSAFSFKIDGEEIAVNAEKDNVFSRVGLVSPGTYSVEFRIEHNGNTYYSEDVKLKISKKTVTVTALLNGVENLTVNEGETINVNYNYDGGMGADVIVETVNGVRVNSLKDDVLSSKAYVGNLPTKAVTNYIVAASSARSDFYDFEYKKSVLTILPVVVPELTFKSKNVVLASVSGDYGVSSSLYFENVGVSASSDTFASAKEKINFLYSGKDIVTKYDMISSYLINVLESGEKPYSAVSGFVRVSLDKSLRNKREYKVIALYNNGDTDILNATLTSSGYLAFSAADMGYFVVAVPTEGISAYTYAIVVVIGVVVIFLVIFFVALFRRKY